MRSSDSDGFPAAVTSGAEREDVHFLSDEIRVLKSRIELLEKKVEHISTSRSSEGDLWYRTYDGGGKAAKAVSGTDSQVPDDYSRIIRMLEDITDSNDFQRVYLESEEAAKLIMHASGGVNEKTAKIMHQILNRMVSRYYEDPKTAGNVQERFHINVNFLDDPIIIEMWLCNFLDFIFKQRFIERYSSVKPVFDYIDEHIKEYINMSSITENCHLSQQYLLRLFKERMKMSAVEYIQSRKMLLAKWYLYFEEYSTLDVASKLGYVDAGYFSKVFRKYSGLTPYQYKMKVRKKA